MNKAQGMHTAFKIADLDFNITHAALRARLSTKLSWSLKIVASYPGGRIADAEWEPVLLWHDIGPFRRVVRSWTDLLGHTFAWQAGYDDATDSRHATLGVFSHNEVYDCAVLFTPLDFTRGAFELSGQCDVHFDDQYGEGLRLTIRTPFQFEGIDVGHRDEATARRDLALHIKSGEFRYEKASPSSAILVPVPYRPQK